MQVMIGGGWMMRWESEKEKRKKEGSLPPANIDTFSPAQLGGAYAPSNKVSPKSCQEDEQAMNECTWAGSIETHMGRFC